MINNFFRYRFFKDTSLTSRLWRSYMFIIVIVVTAITAGASYLIADYFFKTRAAELAYKGQEIADTVGKARATISNLLRLLSLVDSVKILMQEGALDMGHARAILTLKPKDQEKIAQIVIEKNLSVRQTEQLVRDLSEPKTEKPKAAASPDLDQLTQKLSERFNANVKIDHNKQGKGKLVIHYHSLDELDGILNICVPGSE